MRDRFADLCASAAAELGYSRPAGQVFAIVFMAENPPTADGLCASLGLSRSNVSTALKELRVAGLVSVVRLPGDRKEYFSAPDDPWETVLRLIASRRRRLMDPLLDGFLRLAAEGDGRAVALTGPVTALSRLAEEASRLDPTALGRLVSAGLQPDERRKGKKRKKKD